MSIGVQINDIKDAKLREVATSVDLNNDLKLSGDEYSLFAKKAMEMGATYNEISEALDMNAFERWYFDVDKVCTDGKDDGKLTAGEIAESSVKGFFGGILKGIAKNPITTAITLGLGTVATVATGGAALPLIIGLGAAASAYTIGTSAYNYAKADNDYDAKMALESMGTGTAGLALSAAGVKSANKAAANAGVKSLQGLDNASWGENSVAMFKSIPEALRVSGQNIRGNVLTWTTGNVHAHSNKLRGAEEYYSKPNDVEAYKFNPNGTPEEILANNPHVEQVNGKFGVVDKWKTGDLQELITSGKTEAEAIELLKLEPSQVSGGKVYHIVDPTKTQMIMMYDEAGGDFAICEGGVFKGSYVDQAAFKQSGVRDYQDPANLAYGQRVAVTKQAPGAFKALPSGTKVQTVSEGVQTVTDGSVVTLDHQGNPYVMPASNMLKRNTGFSDNAMRSLYQMDPAAVYKHQPAWMQANKPYEYEIAQAQSSFSNSDIRAAIAEAAEQVRDKSYVSASRPNYAGQKAEPSEFGPFSAGAADIKEQALLNRGVGIEVEYDSYYGRSIVGTYYTYNGQKFNIPQNVGYNEALDALLNGVFDGGLPLNKSIFE